MRPNLYANPVIAALVMASIIKCGGKVKKPCTGAPLILHTHRSRR